MQRKIVFRNEQNTLFKLSYISAEGLDLMFTCLSHLSLSICSCDFHVAFPISNEFRMDQWSETKIRRNKAYGLGPVYGDVYAPTPRPAI